MFIKTIYAAGLNIWSEICS